jgi:hypothetical protein
MSYEKKGSIIRLKKEYNLKKKNIIFFSIWIFKFNWSKVNLTKKL